MDNINQTRLIMIRFAILIVELAIRQDYILISSTKECFDILWDCQCALLEFKEDSFNSRVAKAQLKEDKDLARSYVRQLLNVAAQGVFNKHPVFINITQQQLDKIVLI